MQGFSDHFPDDHWEMGLSPGLILHSRDVQTRGAVTIGCPCTSRALCTFGQEFLRPGADDGLELLQLVVVVELRERGLPVVDGARPEPPPRGSKTSMLCKWEPV